MRVFKCDRCGNYYEGVPNIRYGSKYITLTMPAPQRSVVEVVQDDFDLCDTCFIELKEWLGVKDDEEEK